MSLSDLLWSCVAFYGLVGPFLILYHFRVLFGHFMAFHGFISSFVLVLIQIHLVWLLMALRQEQEEKHHQSFF